tara:strand:- start:1109 stop:1444 length:336 start_codon:yes stop_codon:yes gene_type:complete
MATLANQGVATQASFGQLGSGFLDTDDEYTPPSGYVVVAITCLADTAFDTLTSEDGTKYFGFAAAGAGGNSQAIVAANIFPQGITIYGRWTNVGITADSAGGVICYLGPAA